MRDSPTILWLEDVRIEHLPRVGGKLARLGELAAGGYPVPPGFVIPVEVFEQAIPLDVRRELALIERHAPAALADLEAAASNARQLIMGQSLPGWLEDAVSRAYERLAERAGLSPDVPTAVRSSGVSEDSKEASFAGQFDTYLGVRGATAVLEHVKKCWASQYSARAVGYRRRRGREPDAQGIAVGVLQLLLARTSGIAFSLDPTTGNRDRVVIEAAWGLGEAVVSGRVTPDTWMVDKRTGRIVEERVADKRVRLRFDEAAGRVVEESIEEALRNRPCLGHDEIGRIAETVAAIEHREDCAQDVEWAFDERLTFPNSFFVLQHRAETTWGSEHATSAYDPVQYTLEKVFNIAPQGDQ